MNYLDKLREKDPASALAYHLDGLLEAARNVEAFLVKLGELPELNQEDIQTAIIHLDVEIYHHLFYHMKELRHPLRRLEATFADNVLHITRGGHGLEAQNEPITLDEIERLVATDSEISISSTVFYDRDIPEGGRERVHSILWTARPDKIPFWFRGGEITADDPDGPTIVKMLEIAEKLEAQVIDDNEAIYVVKGSPPGWEAKEG